jgi:hypothetical protein
MEKINPGDLIPEQEIGSESNTEATVEFGEEGASKDFYTIVKERLLNVNNWHHYAGALSSDFQLTDSGGNEVKRKVQVGDHFKIKIPAPGPVTGDGYDWVRVEAVEEVNEENEQMVAIKVHPATNPTNADKSVAHFFTDDASSSFIVKIENKKVTAGVYGRNEKPNVEADKIVDKARNAAVATGAITGFSKLQWKQLVTGLLKETN